ncbi:hypothetical protein RN346_16265 [Halomonas sp. PAMB 3232]|uniref:hypothetical protein n=1 Tax=Halomonas sp. PAMB 3232 TaxID=3075221 RepID=UPI0028A1F907|nr:hypothetical protein [Halomonas sp. PAMB 3232]WNL38825.1 hypothetical protein RN346_16265 [Halomonas sp. PAMB 3232]
MRQAQALEASEADARAVDAPVADAHVANAHVADAHVADAHVAKIPLAVVGLGSKQREPVIARLDEWSRLGRRWAATPESWEVVPVDADAPLQALCARYSRWALWVRSDAEAFAAMYRTLRLVSEHQGPKRLLALHEPGLPRAGLLENLRAAATAYLGIELLLLAR